MTSDSTAAAPADSRIPLAEDGKPVDGEPAGGESAAGEPAGDPPDVTPEDQDARPIPRPLFIKIL